MSFKPGASGARLVIEWYFLLHCMSLLLALNGHCECGLESAFGGKADIDQPLFIDLDL
jgi:hypothetical protein